MLTILVTLNSINIFIDRSNIFRLCRSANGVRDRVEMALFVSDIFVICLIWFKHNAESDEIRRQLLASSIV
jgi:hypothetical protein